VTATRKFGGAVRRNRAKRLIRELFRRNRAALPACALDLVVNAHGAMLGRSYDELEPEWLRLLGQLDRRLGR
jgi:ribonuclease P protein component